MSFAAAMVSVVLFAFLNLFHEHACGLESGDFVLRDDDGGVFGDVAGCLLGTCFDNEATETAEIYVFTVGKRVFHYFHEPLDCGEDSGFVDARAFVDFVDNVGFCHCCEFI